MRLVSERVQLAIEAKARVIAAVAINVITFAVAAFTAVDTRSIAFLDVGSVKFCPLQYILFMISIYLPKGNVFFNGDMRLSLESCFRRDGLLNFF